MGCNGSVVESGVPQSSSSNKGRLGGALRLTTASTSRAAERNHKHLYRYIVAKGPPPPAASAAATSRDKQHFGCVPPLPVKMMLLGAGESGKSTIVKQMKVIHSSGLDKSEALTFVPIINSNILTSLVLVLSKVKKINIKIECSKEIENFYAFINKYEENSQKINQGVPTLPESTIKNIKCILEDKNILKCLKNTTRFWVGDSALYYFSNFDRISSPNYIPTLDDIVRTRVKTVGVHETNFHYKNYQFSLTDVGGQRSERKKWVHCFDGINIVLFVASLTDYANNMEENESKNRMIDSLELFDSILKVNHFINATFVLILNKSDLFKELIKHKSLKSLFPEYSDPGSSFVDSVNFIKSKFLSLNKDENRYIYTHVTCATDTSNIEFVFRSVADSMIKKDMELASERNENF